MRKFIEKNPGSTAKFVAQTFGVTRKEVNAILYAHSGVTFRKNDTDYTWFLAGDNFSEVATRETHSVAQIGKKKVLTEHTVFPGYSLFKIENENDVVRLSLNTNHVYFKNLRDKSGLVKLDEVTVVLEALASALEHQYTEMDFIEEFVNDWGYLLHCQILNIEK